MTNLVLLKNKINESGKTITSVANKIGISREALHKKLSGETEFKASEMQKISDELLLNDEEKTNIFFAK